jgi:cation-transporting ATPase E
MAVFVMFLGAPVLNAIHDFYGRLDLHETVRAAAVVVALVPQGLSFMVTATYAMAAVRIGRGGALVQRLNAVESMSHIDVLCLDKTGTLTTNQLSLEAVAPFGIHEAEFKRLLGTFAASASVSNRTNEAILKGCQGEPSEVAGEIGFDSARKWSALQYAAGGPGGVFVLGAPENMAAGLVSDEGIAAKAGEWTSQGLRVLLFARGEAPPEGIDGEKPELPRGLVSLGLVALRDELRPDAGETVNGFARGGIELKIISGDNPQTVAALAMQAGFGDSLKTVAGPELEGLDDRELERIVSEATIFGRIAPQHKEALVKALQRRGHYVAMTGDGVNDVPALKQSNVAIAVKSGSPVTRNVADIVLLNDSFGVLPSAFSEGQRIRAGMASIIRLFLVRTFAVSLAILGASLLGDSFPITPRQSGVPALLTVGLPALALAVWARPQKTGRYLLPSVALFVVPAAVTIAVTSLLLYHFYLSGPDNITEARTVLTITSTVCGLVLLPFVQDPPERWMTVAGLRSDFRTTLLALAMFAGFLVSYLVPPLRDFYELEMLDIRDYGIIAAAVALWAVVLSLAWRIDWEPLVKPLRDLAAPLTSRIARRQA